MFIKPYNIYQNEDDGQIQGGGSSTEQVTDTAVAVGDVSSEETNDKSDGVSTEQLLHKLEAEETAEAAAGNEESDAGTEQQPAPEAEGQQQPEGDLAAEGQAAQQPAQEPAQQLTPEQEEAAFFESLPSRTGVQKKNKQRFHDAINDRNEARAQVASLTESVQQQQEFIAKTNDLFKSVGAEDGQLGMAMEFLQTMRQGQQTGNPQMIRQARDMARQVDLDLSSQLGEQAHGFDPLSEYPQLRARVNNLEMDEQTAMGIVQREKENQLLRAGQQNQQNQAQQLQQQQARVNAAQTQIAQMEQQWIANDPNYPAKQAILLENINIIKQSVAPEQWAQTLLMNYNNMGRVAAGAQQQRLPDPAAMRGNARVKTTNTGPKTTAQLTDEFFG